MDGSSILLSSWHHRPSLPDKCILCIVTGGNRQAQCWSLYLVIDQLCCRYKIIKVEVRLDDVGDKFSPVAAAANETSGNHCCIYRLWVMKEMTLLIQPVYLTDAETFCLNISGENKSIYFLTAIKVKLIPVKQYLNMRKSLYS